MRTALREIAILTVHSWDGATADELRAEINRRLTVLQEAGIIELQVIEAPEER
jgi:hypothetical protein